MIIKDVGLGKILKPELSLGEQSLIYSLHITRLVLEIAKMANSMVSKTWIVLEMATMMTFKLSKAIQVNAKMHNIF